jgi:hypothetical protein
MSQQRIYYEYGENDIVPYWFVITFEACELNWDKPIYYFHLDNLMKYEECNAFEESLYSMSLLISDFIFSNINPGKVGINTSAIKKRILKYNVDPSVIRQLIAPIVVINEVLQLIPNKKIS